MTRRATTRAGFGLIELLVSISIILTLAGIAFLMYPGVRDQDRVRNAVTDVGSTCKLAQGMAARDKRPRGVRFIVDPSKPAAEQRWVTELQYIELPPPLIPNRNPLTPSSQNPTANPAFEPLVRFTYTVAGATAANPGAITGRRCFIENLTADQATLVRDGCTIVMPAFGTWHTITGVAVAPNDFREVLPAGSGRYNGEVFLEVFPDAVMGGGTSAVIHHFAIYLRATPLVGEPTVLLPKNICVDLNLGAATAGSERVGSLLPPGTVAGDFDVIFAPDGKLVGANTGQLFLLVRDYTKGVNFAAANMTATAANGPNLVAGLRRSGEAHFLTIRSSGALGHAPVTWPDMASGMYTGGQTPFTLARQELNQ